MVHRTAQGIVADAAAATSGTLAAASWLTAANDVLQLFATGIAIVAGFYAIKWHKAKIHKLENDDEQSD